MQFWGNNAIPSNQHNLGGTVLGTPSAVSWGPDRIDIVYPGSGLPGISDTGWKVWDPTRGGWQVENRIAVDSFLSGAAITSFKPGHLEMWWRGEGNSWRKKSYYGLGLWEGAASIAGVPGSRLPGTALGRPCRDPPPSSQGVAARMAGRSSYAPYFGG